MFGECQHFSKFSSTGNICQCSVCLTTNSSGICMDMCACEFDVKTKISLIESKVYKI